MKSVDIAITSGSTTRVRAYARAILQPMSITTGRGGYERRKDVRTSLVAWVNYRSIGNGIGRYGGTSHNR